MRVAASSSMISGASFMYRHAVAGSKLVPEIAISEPGAAVGLLPAPPVIDVMNGTGRAVKLNDTGARPGAVAVTRTGPASGPRVAVMLATPSAPVETVDDESNAVPWDTENETGA